MSNEEFLVQLEQLLQGKMPLQELQNVMDYHREYFAEAGENAAAELDPPEIIARRVLDEYFAPPDHQRSRLVKPMVTVALLIGLVVVLLGSVIPRRLIPFISSGAEDKIMQVEEYTYAGTALTAIQTGDEIYTSGVLEPFDAVVVEGVSDDVSITWGDDFAVTMGHDKHASLDCVVRDNTLHITGAAAKGHRGGNISITVPNGAELSRVKVETDLGDITMDSINAGEVELDTEWGNISVSSGTFNTLDCDSDMGDVSVTGVTADILECCCDNGNVDAIEFTAQETTLEADLGSITAVAVGAREDYRLDLTAGLGTVTVDGLQRQTHYATVSGKTNACFLSAKADVGNITLDFTN